MSRASQLWTSLVALVDSGRAAWILVPTYLFALGLELAVHFALRRRWETSETWCNILSGVIGVPVNALAGLAFASLYLAVYRVRIFTAPLDPLWLVVTLLVLELCHYWQHRIQHEVGLFWAFHSVHHSAEEMNVTVPLRIMWGMSLFEPIYLLMPLFGFSLLHYGLSTLLMSIWGIAVHTRTVPKLGMLEHIFVTPANHRVHHGKELQYLDKNYGLITIVFDKLFKTHQLEGVEPSYGLRSGPVGRNVFAVQVSGLSSLAEKMRSAERWRDRLAYLVMPPGWSHTGHHQTTRAMLSQPMEAR